MTFRLLPKDVRFFDLFVAAGENLHAAATRLHEMVSTYENINEHVVEIQRLEKAGDGIDREINQRLEDAFITPFDREDIHELTVQLDDVVDGIQAVGRDARHLRHRGTDRRGSRAHPDPRRPVGRAARGAAQARRAQGRRCRTSCWSTTSSTRPTACRARRSARLFRDGSATRSTSSNGATCISELENAIDAAEDAAEAIERMFHKAT